MKTTIIIRFMQYIPAGMLILMSLGCEREISELEPATYPVNPEVFIDEFSPGLNYAAFGGTTPTAFDVDKDVTWNNSEASMRFEVPDANDPTGAYAGGVFFTSVGRDLSGFNALTFYAKASQPASIDVVGFGNDFAESKYQVSLSGLQVNTAWKKYILPVPDPSKLSMERGMFFYSEGPENERGYTFWIDELKFEKLGTLAHPSAAILNGQEIFETIFSGASRSINGLLFYSNLPTGVDIAVSISPAYLSFSSSDEAIATVNASGEVSVVGEGTAVITAMLGNVEAKGSLSLQSAGSFQHAPTPQQPAENVISIYTEAYPNVPVDYYNGYWAPYQTTLSEDFEVNGDFILHYTNFNFVGIQFSSPTVNASSMTHLHLDIYLPTALNAGAEFKIQLVDFGADGVFGGTDNSNFTLSYKSPTLVALDWISFDIPLSSFTGLKSRAHLAQIIFEGVNIPNFYADNIYFYK